MSDRHSVVLKLRQTLRSAITGPHILAFLPAIVLGAFWAGGETWLLAVSLGMPAVFAMAGGFSQWSTQAYPPDVPLKLEDMVIRQLTLAGRRRQNMACFLLQIDDFDQLIDHHGLAASQTVTRRIVDRIGSTLRQGDLIMRSDHGQFSIVTLPMQTLTIEVAIQLARRIQDAVEEPISIDASSLYVSCSIGFVIDQQIADPTALQLIDAAEAALEDARTNGASSIRAYAPTMRAAQISRDALLADAETALENGEIHPWFQPQVSTDTGLITGFEALARWSHPTRGVVPPSDFLPLLERHGLMEQLGQVILTKALLALAQWDRAGFTIPCVGVNFSPAELRNPKLSERIMWELDRFDLPAHRLGIEVLETVVAASPDDVVARNINGLADLGCPIDLDDFGTGHASISSIRRFAVQRLKIDRSYVTSVDKDPEQQRMISAILTMAEQLDLKTVAEGVETPGEHAMLSQLGCTHVQGYGIARPMPFEQTLDWIRAHQAKLAKTPSIGRQTG
ncbi:MAG: EAL domain-containing protein [Thalassovita sp.]